MLGTFITLEGVTEVCAGYMTHSVVSFLKAGSFLKLSTEGIKAFKSKVRDEKIKQQYLEVADEVY